jgi:tRNA (guanine-N7-)-methyltransferase
LGFISKGRGMQNRRSHPPVYTPRYVALIEERRAALEAELATILSPGTPFVFELGCGHGHFLAAFAAANPDRVCVGIDLIGERIDRAQRKRDRARLSNLHFLQAEARLFLQTIPAGALISTVFILFPDPWPKLRHNKHRIIQPAFLAALAARSIPRCPLYFRTDFEPYYEAARSVLSEDPEWALETEPWAFDHPTVFQERAPRFHSIVARRRPTLAAVKLDTLIGNTC